MSEENVESAVDASVAQPSETMVTINNRAVPISQAESVIGEMEHNLKSGYDRKLADERAALVAALDEDTTFYRDHADRPDLWESYEPKVGGGRGFTGDAAQLTVAPTKPTQGLQSVQPAQQAAFGDQTKMAKLERDLATVRETLNSVVGYNNEVAKNAVIKTVGICQSKYPAADTEGVKAQLQVYYNRNNQRHATPEIVEDFMRQSNERMSKKFNIATPSNPTPNEPSSATPIVKSGVLPTTPSPKIPNMFNDMEGFKKYVGDHLTGNE